MDFSKYKFFYVNGTSHTEGGGLEEPAIRSKSVLPIYKKIHNVEWNNRTEINYGKRLEQILGIKCINEAISGGGLSRVVRTTYDFIFKHWDDRDNFFIILDLCFRNLELIISFYLVFYILYYTYIYIYIV
jgi:hypothetical protein